MPTHVLIVEDHPLFAEALQSALWGAMPNTRFEQAGSIAEARTAYKMTAFDLVLLDLSLPDNHGFSSIIELRRKRPKVPVIVVSAYDDDNIIHCAMACGASGFISKSEGKSTLISSIKNVLQGGITLPKTFLPENASENSRQISIQALNCLTLQELRVLQMLCQGLLNKQISHEFRVSESTIKAHVSAILSKLKVSSRTQAVIEASKFCLSPIPAFLAQTPTSIDYKTSSAREHFPLPIGSPATARTTPP